MPKEPARSSEPTPDQLYWGAAIPMQAIRHFARVVAERFHPDKIILFGSHAHGTPHVDSDVDILVVMAACNKHSQAVRIRAAVPAPFPLDLLVRTPQEMTRGLQGGDTFLTAIVSKGKVLYESGHARVGEEGGGRLPRCHKPRPKQASPA
jgi:uncharacterized protein